MEDQKKGMAFAFLGGVILSFDTLFIRLIDFDPLQLAFWRGTLMCMSGMIACAFFKKYMSIKVGLINGKIGIIVAIFYGLASFFFVQAALKTSIANMLVIIATAPLWAAIGSSLYLKEETPYRTWIASIISLLGMVIVAWPNLSDKSWIGDFMALITALCMAMAFILSRRSQINLVFAPAVGGGLSAIAILPFLVILEFGTQRTEQIFYMVIEGAILVPLALGLIAMAPRYVPAPQVSLFLLLETILGPVWIWLVLNEEPTRYAIIGGVIVIITLITHSGQNIRRMSH